MKLWIGAEIEADIGDQFRNVRRCVVDTINSYIDFREYDLGVESWDCIAIVRDDDCFPEKFVLNRKNGDMDFRIRIDYSKFKSGDRYEQKRLIFEMLEKSLLMLKEKNHNNGIDALLSDIKDGLIN
ncbi:Imm44 family immunity protein [Rhodanobacter spathiphylli]|uniref:Imm44 family immunity protein n=1 Tax=Rhodanobacter spathiphylli TaxID=347483 RepID=UPI000A0348F7|nr:Imm44 family immunity protein [Rhodanobacter spathiphylli]